MAVKKGRFGKFLGCTGYPECRNIMKYKARGEGVGRLRTAGALNGVQEEHQ